jgi:hypothetical protein
VSAQDSCFALQLSDTQLTIMLLYIGFIVWALSELYRKVKELRYMKIAAHLKAVYIPRVSLLATFAPFLSDL